MTLTELGGHHLNHKDHLQEARRNAIFFLENCVFLDSLCTSYSRRPQFGRTHRLRPRIEASEVFRI